MKLKHSKIKNTGILFELLTRQITSDIIAGKSQPVAMNLLRKYFHNTEIAKEYTLYKSLTTKGSAPLLESKADKFIDTAIDLYSNINREKLRREKYNLIKEIKNNYDIDSFLGARVDNYKLYASVFSLFEHKCNPSVVNPEFVLNNRYVLLEYLTSDTTPVENLVLNEYNSKSKGERGLIFKILVDKFNSKYTKELSDEQQVVLKEYISSISNLPALKNFVSSKTMELKKYLKYQAKVIEDTSTKIKLNEVISHIPVIDKNYILKDGDVLQLLQLLELKTELESL